MTLITRILALLTIANICVSQSLLPQDGRDVELEALSRAVGSVLEWDSHPRCSVILLTDGTTSPNTLFKAMGQLPAPWGVTLFEMAADSQDANTTQEQLSRLVGEARKLRQLSWSVMVVVVSEEPAFLDAFAQWCLKGRLLVWSTRLLVVTRLPLHSLKGLLTSHWTFSMMNTMFLVLDDTQGNIQCVMYSHLPYSPSGADTIPVASWSTARGLTISRGSLFPEKFNNFHGARVNITGLPWPPFFIEYMETSPEGTSIKQYKGPDGLLFRTIASTLNFTYSFLPVNDWGEAAYRVVERKSLMLVISHVLLPNRAERYDYTYAYIFTFLGFGLAKPLLKPQWQSLYYPLADEVWVSTLAVLLLMPGIMYMISWREMWSHQKFLLHRDVPSPQTSTHSNSSRGFGAMFTEIFGTFVGQNLSKRLPSDTPSRSLMATWLVLAFIIGTVYRGNLTASLTLPKYPSRPETLEELVTQVDRVTMPPFGTEWQKHFRRSNSRTLEKLGDLMYIGPSVLEGLHRASEKEAHLTTRLVFLHMTAEHFTQADGSSPLYFGRENIDPGISAWPIPHDAPYKHELDWIMMAAGLYDKWTRDTLDETRRKSRQKHRKLQREQEYEKAGDEAQKSSSSSGRALTLVHMQAPLMLLFLGLVISCLTFSMEILAMRWNR